MELCLVHNDPTQTLLITPEGTPLYGIQTPRDSAAATTTVRRLGHEAGSGLVSTEVGRIDFCGSSGTKLLLCNTNHELTLGPYDQVAQVENSWTFTGPDNRPYKWQIFIQSPVLILNDNSLTPIARYRRAKLGIVHVREKHSSRSSPLESTSSTSLLSPSFRL
ncbi:hypothetical protein BD779DRAFT_463331 [Infundibulicybe gibba]|nr:hypothetical protein BD779DRAFT_463331 [Infundibulicybe gibba]